MNTENVFFSFTGENNLLLNCFYFDFVIAVENFSDIFGWIWRVVISFQQQFFFSLILSRTSNTGGSVFPLYLVHSSPAALPCAGNLGQKDHKFFSPRAKKRK